MLPSPSFVVRLPNDNHHGFVGAWAAAFPASVLLFPAGVLMLAAED